MENAILDVFQLHYRVHFCMKEYIDLNKWIELAMYRYMWRTKVWQKHIIRKCRKQTQTGKIKKPKTANFVIIWKIINDTVTNDLNP